MREFSSRLPLARAIKLLLIIGVVLGAGGITRSTGAADVVLCTVEPLALPELTELAAASPGTASSPVTALDGARPANASVIADVTEVIAESIACVNANDPLRALAFFTPDYLQRRFGGANGDDLGHLLAALTRKPGPASPADELTLLSIDRISSLPDGSVSARVTTANRTRQFVDLLHLVLVDGAWRIDDVALGEPEVVATPET